MQPAPALPTASRLHSAVPPHSPVGHQDHAQPLLALLLGGQRPRLLREEDAPRQLDLRLWKHPLKSWNSCLRRHPQSATCGGCLAPPRPTVVRICRACALVQTQRMDACAGTSPSNTPGANTHMGDPCPSQAAASHQHPPLANKGCAYTQRTLCRNSARPPCGSTACFLAMRCLARWMMSETSVSLLLVGAPPVCCW